MQSKLLPDHKMLYHHFMNINDNFKTVEVQSVWADKSVT